MSTLPWLTVFWFGMAAAWLADGKVSAAAIALGLAVGAIVVTGAFAGVRTGRRRA